MPAQRGEDRPGATLKEKHVRAIRKAWAKEPRPRGLGRRLAAKYGVTPAMISKVVKKLPDGRWASWNHV